MDNKGQFRPTGRCFGHYRCTKCSRTWMSGNSWPNLGQECQTCRINVLAYLQTPLKHGIGADQSDAPHRSDLCEKCKRLGRCCTVRRF